MKWHPTLHSVVNFETLVIFCWKKWGFQWAFVLSSNMPCSSNLQSGLSFSVTLPMKWHPTLWLVLKSRVTIHSQWWSAFHCTFSLSSNMPFFMVKKGGEKRDTRFKWRFSNTQTHFKLAVQSWFSFRKLHSPISVQPPDIASLAGRKLSLQSFPKISTI